MTNQGLVNIFHLFMFYVNQRRSLSKLFLEQTDVKDASVLVRANFSLPLDESGEVQDTSFLRDLVPTIKYLQVSWTRNTKIFYDKGWRLYSNYANFFLSFFFFLFKFTFLIFLSFCSITWNLNIRSLKKMKLENITLYLYPFFFHFVMWKENNIKTL